MHSRNQFKQTLPFKKKHSPIPRSKGVLAWDIYWIWWSKHSRGENVFQGIMKKLAFLMNWWKLPVCMVIFVFVWCCSGVWVDVVQCLVTSVFDDLFCSLFFWCWCNLGGWCGCVFNVYFELCIWLACRVLWKCIQWDDNTGVGCHFFGEVVLCLWWRWSTRMVCDRRQPRMVDACDAGDQ